MQTDVFVLDHDPACLQAAGNIQILLTVVGWGGELLSKRFFFHVFSEGDAVHRTDVDTCVALDAELVGEHGLHIAVQASLRFLGAKLAVKPEFNFKLDVGKRLLLFGMRHQKAGRRIVRAVVGPLMHTHLGADQVEVFRGAILVQVTTLQEEMHRDRRLVRMRRCPDDVLGAKRGITAKEHLRQCRLQCEFIENRTFPLVELDTQIPLDPRAMIFLSDGHQYMIALDKFVGLATGFITQFAVRSRDWFEHFEDDALELAILMHKLFGWPVVEDGNAFRHGIFFLPRRRFHHFERTANHDLYGLGSQPYRRPTAIHGGVATPHHDHFARYRRGMAEGNARQPVDANRNVFGDLLASRQFKIASTRCTGTDEIGVITKIEHGLHALDLVSKMRCHAEVENQIDLFVEHSFRQSKRRDLTTHEAASFGLLVVDVHFITHGQQIACHGQGRRSRTKQSDFLAVLDLGYPRQPGGYITLVVGSNTFQTTDGHRLFFSAHTTASGFTRTITGPAEYPRKNVRIPIEHIRFGVTLLGNQSDVLGNRRVGRAGPLTIHDLVKIAGIKNVGWFHQLSGGNPSVWRLKQSNQTTLAAHAWHGQQRWASISWPRCVASLE